MTSKNTTKLLNAVRKQLIKNRDEQFLTARKLQADHTAKLQAGRKLSVTL